MYLKDTCETARAILAGELDSDLDYIIQAATARKKDTLKRMFRKGSEIRVTVGKLAGQEGIVLKINPKTISIGLGEKKTEYIGTERFDFFEGGEWNVSHGMVEAI